MNFKTHLIYFSPTRTTQKIVERIAAGLGSSQVVNYDLTRTETGFDHLITDGVAIIGIPVYAGRVPQVCLDRLQKLTSRSVPTVLVALYGNREFEDALLELRDVVTAAGFSVIAAGAFIGEHSYSTAEQPIAVDRPDQADLAKAVTFGKTIAKRLLEDDNLGIPDIPGAVPYKERIPLGGIAPETDKNLCTLCSICAKVCPTFVIEVDSEVVTNADTCIMCCACVKNCPESARALAHPVVQTRRDMLSRNCSARKEPAFFIE